MNDSALNKITAFFWNIFCLNFIFIASNIVLISVLLFVIFHWITILLYLIALFLLLVSFQAMFLTVKKSSQLDEMSMISCYIYVYRGEFKNLSLYASAYLGIAMMLSIGYINIRLIGWNQPLFTTTYLLLFVLLYIHFIFSLLIRVNFIIDMKGTWRLGLYCISKYPFYCLLIFAKTLILGWAIQIIPALLFLGIVPLFGYSVIKMTTKIFKELEMTLSDTKAKP